MNPHHDEPERLSDSDKHDSGLNAVVVRRATADDIEDIWPLARDFATSFTPRRAAFESTFPQLMSKPHTLLLVAVHAGEIRGYLLGHTHLTFLANAPIAWIEEVMVDSDARRLGIGTALITTAEEWAADEGCAYTSLASRRAAHFYLALGYDDSATFFKKTTPPTRARPER